MVTALGINIFKYSIIILFSALILIITNSVKAEDSISTAITKKEKVTTRIDSMKEKMASREAALKIKLGTFRNKERAAIADRVNTNLNMINKNQTTQMLKHLDTISSILTKLENRVNQNTPDIKDPAMAREVIANARNAIASASAAVSEQAAKDYTIQVTSEGRIRQDAQKQREALHKDLSALRKLVIDAKQSVANAIRVAKSGMLEKEATRSGQ